MRFAGEIWLRYVKCLRAWMDLLHFASRVSGKFSIRQSSVRDWRFLLLHDYLFTLHEYEAAAVSSLYGHSSCEETRMFKKRQKMSILSFAFSYLLPFRKWWKSVINHRILLQKCRNCAYSVSFHLKTITFHLHYLRKISLFPGKSLFSIQSSSFNFISFCSSCFFDKTCKRPFPCL